MAELDIHLAPVPGTDTDRIVVDGYDLTNAVREVTIHGSALDGPVVTVDLAITHGVSVTGAGEFHLSKATREALKALGWTPPCACPQTLVTVSDRPVMSPGLDPFCPVHGSSEVPRV